MVWLSDRANNGEKFSKTEKELENRICWQGSREFSNSASSDGKGETGDLGLNKRSTGIVAMPWKQTRQPSLLFFLKYLWMCIKIWLLKCIKYKKKDLRYLQRQEPSFTSIPRCKPQTIYSHNLLLFTQRLNTLKETKQGLILVIVPLCTNYFY